MTNQTILFLALTTTIAHSAPNASEWYCSNGNSIPTVSDNSISCNSVGGNYVNGWSGNGNALVSKSFYSLLPQESEEVQFEATFRFTCNTWCRTWGFHLGNILNVDYRPPEDAIIKIHGRSYYYNGDLKATTTHYNENNEILFVHTYTIDPSEYSDMMHNKFHTGIERSRSPLDKIELIDFPTNAKKVKTREMSQVSLYDEYFDQLYMDGHMVNDYIYLKKRSTETRNITTKHTIWETTSRETSLSSK